MPIDRPLRDLEVPLERADRDKGGRVEAVAVDGREARATFAAGTLSLKLEFPPARATPTPQPPPPLPAKPAAPKPAPLAPDPYAQ